jgi:hypothetical protein
MVWCLELVVVGYNTPMEIDFRWWWNSYASSDTRLMV